MSTASIEGTGVHTEASPIGWQNTNDGVVLSRHKQKAKAIATGRRLAKRHLCHVFGAGLGAKIWQQRFFLFDPDGVDERARSDVAE